ncbi:MAG: hypothetical protein L3K07_00365 [Thermoplasmata archaeon]|nr:hypothetical protein [Thermoplasmata archaeon]
MRTKSVDGVLRVDVMRLEPRPALYMAYDGLGGLSQRPLLRDLVEELQRQGPEGFGKLLESLRLHHSAQLHVYFSDYVSYGIGGGDATAEFFFGTFLLLHAPPKPAQGSTPATQEELLLIRPQGTTERLLLDPSAN